MKSVALSYALTLSKLLIPITLLSQHHVKITQIFNIIKEISLGICQPSFHIVSPSPNTSAQSNYTALAMK